MKRQVIKKVTVPVEEVPVVKHEHALVNKVKDLPWYKVRNAAIGNGKKDGVLSKIIMYALLIVIAFVFLQPLIEMLFISLMSSKDLVNPEVSYVPTAFMFSNYKTAIRVLDYGKSLFNSIWFSGLLAIFQTIVSALAGYAFARYDFKFKKFWFGVLIVTFLIPVQVLVLPRTMLISIFQSATQIRVMGTVFPQLVLSIFGQGIYSTILILICYNFFKQIPIALDEAAVMDGATTYQTFYHVILKLSAPIIFTIFLFAFVWNWNDTFSMDFYLGGRLALLPTQLGMFDTLFSGGQLGVRTYESYKMAGSILSILPLIVLYVIVQKRFVEGIEQTGMTGQ